MLSLLANGVLAGEVVARYGHAPSQDRAAVRAVTLDRGSSTYPTTPSTIVAPDAAVRSSKRAASTPSGHPGVTKGSVERKLVSLIIATPARNLPPQFVDSTTGLIKNNVQVVCRRRTKRSFLCIVRLPSHPANEGLSFRYRSGPNGRDVFKSYGSRFAALTSTTIR